MDAWIRFDNVYPLRWEYQFIAERALLVVLPQIDRMRQREAHNADDQRGDQGCG